MTTSPRTKLSYAWPTTKASPWTLTVIHGTAALSKLQPEFESWSAQRALPTTARSSWLFATMHAVVTNDHWAVVARDSDGCLQGLVMLFDEHTDGDGLTSLVGTDQGNRGFLTVAAPELAEEMAREVLRVLRSRSQPTTLLVGPLDADDPCVHAFATSLPGARLISDDPVPVIRQTSPDALHYLSHGMQRTVRKAKNRLTKDGCTGSVSFTTVAEEITAVVPQLERCHRDRDHVHGRASDLDDDRGRQLWHARLRHLSRLGELELATLTIDGQFAAHALGALDAPVYRVLEGRFVTEWARYAPGRLLETAVLQRVLDDNAFNLLDWMTAVAPEKLLASNYADPMVRVHLRTQT